MVVLVALFKKLWSIFFGTLLWIFSSYQLYVAFSTGTLIARSSDVSISNWSAPIFVIVFTFWLAVFLCPFVLAGARFHKLIMSYGGNYNINTIKRVIFGPRNKCN